MVSFTLNNRQVSVDADPEDPAAVGHSRPCRFDRHQIRIAARACAAACTVHVRRNSATRLPRPRSARSPAKKVRPPSKACRRIHPTPLQKAWNRGRSAANAATGQSGQIMKAAELLAKNPKPEPAPDIITHMDGNICPLRGPTIAIIAAIEARFRRRP